MYIHIYVHEGSQCTYGVAMTKMKRHKVCPCILSYSFCSIFI